MTDIAAVIDGNSRVHKEGKEQIRIGDWFTLPLKNWKEEEKEYLMCVTSVGTNYVELAGHPLDFGYIERHSGMSTVRLHSNELYKLQPAPDWQTKIAERVQHHQSVTVSLMQQVQDITRRLGVQPRNNLLGGGVSQSEAGTALAVLSGTEDVKKYALDLKSAYSDDLPALFAEMKKANETLSKWMEFSTLPVEIQMKNMQTVMEPLKDRVFQVSLYAGLSEEVVTVADGEPAAYHDKLHIFQLRRYMDEECLLDYRAGGFSFENIEGFDAWLAEPENRDRILPHPRCMVAMRVRRKEKDRDWHGNLSDLFVHAQLRELDKLTFLFIRNGDNIYRINTEIDFPENIFSDTADFMQDEPLMFSMRGNSVDKFITVRAYESMRQEAADVEAKREQWFKDNPFEEWAETKHSDSYRHKECWEYANPFRPSDFYHLRDYEPLTLDSVYYDDAMAKIDEDFKKFNRIALIVQGLLDRSTVLHPHPNVSLSTPEGAEAMLVLVKDGSMVLTHGEKPDFEAFRAELNSQITQDSYFVGQNTAWELAEGVKESRRLDRDWRNRSDYRPKYFRPYGNPGPGDITQAEHVTFKGGKATKVTFVWERDRLAADAWADTRPNPRSRLTVDVEDLLNVSAYKMGDYKKFFADPRTRAEYLQWAPMLIEAEDWCQRNQPKSVHKPRP